MQAYDTEVLIIGGGPVGFALALDLSRRGRRSIVIEQEAVRELHAKAGTLSVRSMEFCRRWGIAARIANGEFPNDFPGDIVYCTALDGHLIGREDFPSADKRPLFECSPEILRRYPQMYFDPLLEETAAATGLVGVKRGARFDACTQDAEGVNADVIDIASGARSTLRARFLVACDGAGSAVRKQAGIPFEGNPALSFSVSALIRKPDFATAQKMGAAERYLIIGRQGTWSNFTCVDGRELWRFTLTGSQEKFDLGQLDMAAEIRRAFGSDSAFEIVHVIPWRRSESVARAYRAGRVFLAGDAAHTMSPTGGHGLNTGLGDVDSLGWTLAAVLEGWGGETLLEAYGIERRPVAQRNSAWSTGNFRAWTQCEEMDQVLDEGPTGDAARRVIHARLSAALSEEWNSHGVSMGYRYDGSPVILPDGSAPPEDTKSDYEQTARPGHRAPHAWLEDGRSTLDLFGDGFVLLHFGKAPYPATLQAAAAARGLPLRAVDMDNPRAALLYGRRFVLVRPDGHVAWRGDSLPQDAGALLDTVRGA